MTTALFDTWTERYDSWFLTPVGRLVHTYEAALLLALLDPRNNERILDAGCGSGLFTEGVVGRGARVTGIDLSVPMLTRAAIRNGHAGFAAACADMRALPFADNRFDKVFSMTAIEFVAEASAAITELNRVTRPGGTVVVTTLNSLSPWAERRRKKARSGHDLFQQAWFRSPTDMLAIVPEGSVSRTAIHFLDDDPVAVIPEKEREGGRKGLDTGALLAVQWRKA